MIEVIQQILNDGTTHMLEQKSLSLSENGVGCMYRGNGGCSCFIGGVITDGAYFPEIESHSCSSRPILRVLKESGYDIDIDKIEYSEYAILLGRMQRNLHDNLSISDCGFFEEQFIKEVIQFVDDHNGCRSAEKTGTLDYPPQAKEFIQQREGEAQ